MKITVVDNFKTETTPWSTEKEFVDFIETNLAVFCNDTVGARYITHKREWPLTETRSFGGNRPRIDLMVETTKGRIGIECKRPTQSYSESSKTLSQLLSYSVIAENNKVPLEKLYILTTEYNQILHQVIQKFELPIHVIVFSRDKRAELQNGN